MGYRLYVVSISSLYRLYISVERNILRVAAAVEALNVPVNVLIAWFYDFRPQADWLWLVLTLHTRLCVCGACHIVRLCPSPIVYQRGWAMSQVLMLSAFSLCLVRKLSKELGV